MGLLYKIRVRLVNFVVFFFLVVLLPGLPPKTTFPFEGFSIPPLKELKGGLEPNNHLDNAERFLENKVYGPEAILVRGNEIYTTITGGEVVRIDGPHVTHIAKFGKPCVSPPEEDICGRPLGLAFDTQDNNHLIVADAYYGIWLVDVSTGDQFQLVSRDTILEGKGVNRKPRLFNSVAVAKNGDIYWTESTSDFELYDGVFTIFANPSGRLFHYDRKTKKNTVLLDRLHFANGLALSPNEEFVVVAETMSSLVHRYYLKGPKAGTDDIFVDGLPGMPDNLIASESGLWAPLVMAADEENPSLPRLLSRVPLIRKFCSRMMALAEMPFRLLHQIWPNSHSHSLRLLHAIGNFETMRFMEPDRVTLVRLDWNGNIVGSLHGFDRSVSAVSHVAEMGDYLILGSPFNDFLARVPIPKVPKMRVQNVRYEQAAEGAKKPEVPTTTTAKPTTTTTTTTTPKPTTTTTTKKPVTTTTTTPKPTTTTTTTPKPTTAKPVTTTTPKPTTTTEKPAPKPSTTTTAAPPKKPQEAPKKATEKPAPSTEKPTPAVTEKPAPATEAPAKKKEKKQEKAKPTTTPAPERTAEPAPIHEKIPNDTPKPKQEKLKVIKRGGEQGEL